MSTFDMSHHGDRRTVSSDEATMTPIYSANIDPEKQAPIDSQDIAGLDAVPAEALVSGNSWYARTQRVLGKFGVEARGIERVPEDERTDSSLYQIGTMVCDDFLSG
jgi:hypothetical protein